MVEYETLLSIPFLNKSRFTGSDRGMRYSVYKKETVTENEEGEKKVTGVFLEAVVCPGPFSVDCTNKELFTANRFSYDDEGRKAAVDWINEMYKERFDFFEDVYLHPDRYYKLHHS